MLQPISFYKQYDVIIINNKTNESKLIDETNGEIHINHLNNDNTLMDKV